MNVEFTFKYRTRTELASLYADWNQARKELAEKAQQDDADLPGIASAEMDMQVEQIKQIVVGWKFDEELNDANIRDLVEISVRAADAVINAYSKAFSEARLGN